MDYTPENVVKTKDSKLMYAAYVYDNFFKNKENPNL